MVTSQTRQIPINACNLCMLKVPIKSYGSTLLLILLKKTDKLDKFKMAAQTGKNYAKVELNILISLHFTS